MEKNLLIQRLKKATSIIEPGQDVEVALFEAGDALGVSLCYYEIYGASFPIDHVYDPDEVARRNATNDQHTVVARTPKGEIVGLAGLFHNAPNQDIYEAGQLMLQKSYRNGPIAAKIVKLVTGDLPKSLDLPVIFCETVCNHSVSQRLAIEQGHHPTGLELECMPSSAYSKEKSGTRNVSLLLTFDIRKDLKHTIYLPGIYGDFFSNLFNRIGLDRKIGDGRNLAGDTEFEEFLLPETKFARMTVQKAGHDFQRLVEKAESTAGQGGLVQMYLNLGDMAAPGAVRLLNEKGYFLGGLLPLWFGSDGLIMQKLPKAPAWDGIHLHGKDAHAIASYIRQDYERVNPAP